MSEEAIPPFTRKEDIAAAGTLRPVGGRPYRRDDAAAELRRYVAAAGLQPGDKLPSERELGAQLRLSRTSVREALRFLEHEGLLDVGQGRPAIVRPFDVARVIEPVVHRLAAERGVLRDLLVVRGPLEVLAAQEAAARRSEADLRDMQACLDRTRASLERRREAVEEDVRFHDLLYRAAGNSVLLAISRAVHGLLRSVRDAALLLGHPPERLWEHHSAIYHAVAAGDVAGAEAAMREHMAVVREQQEAALRLLDQVALNTTGATGSKRVRVHGSSLSEVT